MTDFSESNWAKAEFSRQYRNNADIYIVERRRMLDILKSFYKHFFSDKTRTRILDLGCGDGILTYELLKIDNRISATLMDGSEDMLARAKERLNDFRNIQYIQTSFQDVLKGEFIQKNFDFVVSSMAIHHLTTDEKKGMFKKIHSLLHSGGHFVNIDVILAPSETLDRWYMRLWKEWMDEKKKSLGISGDYHDDIIQRYKDNRDNKPDTLENQMNALKTIGYKDVDCYYKYGIFSIYGGMKERKES